MVVLATKLYVEGDARKRSLQALESMIDNSIGELEVTYDIGIRHDAFPSITIDGEDAPVARRLLGQEWGTVTPDRTDGETYIGTLEQWDEDGFILDAGEDVRISSEDIGLGTGSPAQIVERFGLVQHQRLSFVAGETPHLADEQLDQLYDWRRGEGRLNVNSVTRGELRATINRAGHAHDIITIERLGLLEHSVVCKADTDPPGLLANIGQYVQGEMRCVIT